MRSSLLLMTAAFLASGCGGPEYPETVPVTGTVTYQGKPLEGADVVLVPSDAAVRSAGGTTDANGNFSVKTYFDPQNQSEGAMPGEYSVTVAKAVKPDLPADAKPEDMMAHYMKHGAPKPLLPTKYQNPKTSGFKVSVGDSPPEPLKLDLK